MDALFTKIGLSPQKATETANNKKLAPILNDAIKHANAQNGIDKQQGAVLYALASTITPPALSHLPFIAKKIAAGDLKNNDQVSVAIKFLENKKEFSDSDFNAACGVGVVVSPEEISRTISKLLDARAKDLETKRYTLLGQLLGTLRQELRWANSLAVKEELEKQIKERIGEKDERDDPKAKKKKEKESKAAAAVAPESNSTTAAAVPASTSSVKVSESAKSFKFVLEGELARLHKPGENPQINDKLMKEHLARTGGKVVTRFPPEPNGYLHLGHCKAININFGYAAAHGGITYLRYDDTNPEAEKDEYFDSIKEMIEWLGHKPHGITYSSDHFQRLFDLAVDLIKRDKAYICHCTPEEMHEMRGGDGGKGERKECSHRSRPIEESLREFYRMKEGQYAEGEATLRMKMNMQDGNPQFWDLVAYRVMYTPHVRSGYEWCVYPTYDYTHCLCDSFEDITHSLCTTEFQQSRPSYYWLVDALEIYKPVQWEYGRLNITHSIMSKRKLLKLVNEGYVNGWDDPRMFTLVAMRRRGFTPEALNAFVRDLGVSKSDSVIPVERLENYVRDHLNDIAPRLMVVLEPLKITITNLPEDYEEMLTVQNKPRDEAMGTHVIPFTRTVYIDRSDFREVDDPNFFRLVLGKSVGLLNVPNPITAKEVVKDSSGKIVEVKAVYETETSKRPKTYIHWVAESKKHASPVKVQINQYDRLFLHEDPMDEKQVPGGWLSDVNPKSLTVYEAYAEVGIKAAKREEKYQFLRVGYFCVDKESDLENGKFVLNSTVSLKEDSSKKEMDKK